MLTSDTSIINEAMRRLIDMMYSPTNNDELLKIRKRIINAKHGDIFKDELGIKKMLKAGEQRIIVHPDVETFKNGYSKKVQPWETKCLSRDFDSAMCYMIQTETLHPDVVKDSYKKLLILKRMKLALIGENGARRYNGDEYLNLDYHKIKNPWTDNKKQNEAEWFLVSEFATAYGCIAKNLINQIEKNGKASSIEKKLLKFALNGQTEYINRSYARITPNKMTKSNGYRCYGYKLPEAYEAVTLKDGRIKYVPGAHTPLTWAEASLYNASKLYEENLTRIEKVNM